MGLIITLGYKEILALFVVWFVTRIFVLPGYDVGAGGPFSALQINCYSYNNL